MKKIISIILLLCMFALLMVSCGNSESTEPDLTGTESDLTGTESDSPETKPVLPEVTFDNYEFTIYARGPENSVGWQIMPNVYTEVENGETLNDALYTRNRSVEEKYKIKITGVSLGPQSADGPGHANAITALIMSGDDIYDVIIPAMNQVGTLIVNNALIDLNTVPNLQLSNPWWDQNINDVLSIGGKLYATIGDICISTMNATSAVYFNKTIVDNYKIDDPYEFVNDNTWTFDKILELSKQVSEDVNGDGVLDKNDTYGLVVQQTIAGNYYFASGENVTGKDSKNLPIPAIQGSRPINVLDKVVDIMASETGIFVGGDADTALMFAEERGLFYSHVIKTCETLRGNNIDFGILPMPKFDENQEGYYNFSDAHCMSLLTIPMTNTNLERTGVILEALCYESSKTLVPAYYEKNLTGKFFRDDESIEMLEIIRNSRIISIDEVFGWTLTKVISNTVGAKDRSIVSTIEAQIGVLEGNIAKTLETMRIN